MAREIFGDAFKDIVTIESSRVGLVVTGISIDHTYRGVNIKLQPRAGWVADAPCVSLVIDAVLAETADYSATHRQALQHLIGRDMGGISKAYRVRKVNSDREAVVAEMDAINPTGTRKPTITPIGYADAKPLPKGLKARNVEPDYLKEFTMAQRNDAACILTIPQKVAASKEWSHQLRQKAKASEVRERMRVVLDLDWD